MLGSTKTPKSVAGRIPWASSGNKTRAERSIARSTWLPVAISTKDRAGARYGWCGGGAFSSSAARLAAMQSAPTMAPANTRLSIAIPNCRRSGNALASAPPTTLGSSRYGIEPVPTRTLGLCTMKTPDSSPMATLFSGQFSRYYTARPHSRGHGPELDAGPPGLASPSGPAAAAACSRSADDAYLARVTVVVRHCADGDQHQRVCFHQNIALFLLGRPEQRAARFIAAGPDRCQFRKGRCSAPVRQESLLRSWRHNTRRRQPTNPSPPFPLEQRRRRRRGCPRHVHHAGRSLPTAGKSGQDS